MVLPHKLMQNVNSSGVQKEYFSYQEITPTMCDFVNGCSHNCKFCLIFCSWIRLNLPRMVP